MRNRNFERGEWSRQDRTRNRFSTGIFFLAIGGFLLADKMGADFPGWLTSWPMVLIALGVYIGLRHSFRNGPWWILILIGSIFLTERISDTIHLRPYFWPIAFIAVGVYVIFGSRRSKNKDAFYHESIDPSTGTGTITDSYSGPDKMFNDSSDVLDVTAIFSGIKKRVLSKNFRGGDITAIMGGAEIDLTQADFQNRVSIEITNMFGGTKLIIPPDWDVQSQVVAIFGGVDDKRPQSSKNNPLHVINLEGTCLFGGIEIKSF